MVAFSETDLACVAEYCENHRDFLRGDLDLLRKQLGTRRLEEGFEQNGIRRAADVGVGVCPGAIDLEAIFQLCALRRDGQPFFSSEDLWAVDPSLWEEVLQAQVNSQAFLNSFTRKRMTVQQLAEEIRAGQKKPFDLVLSRGVISFGNIGSSGTLEQMRERARGIVRGLTGCLNPENPSSLLVVSTKFDDSTFPLHRMDFTELGLDVVDFQRQRGSDGWTYRLKEKGFIPRGQPGFSIVALRKQYSQFVFYD